jgi:hypothetical protein
VNDSGIYPEMDMAETRIPEEQRGITQHWFTSRRDAAEYVKEMEDYCIDYGFKLSYEMKHEGRDVWKVTLWIKDD